MTLIFYKLNLAAPLSLTIPDVITARADFYDLQVLAYGPWFYECILFNPYHKKRIRHSLHSHGTDNNIYFQPSTEEYVNSSITYNNIDQRDWDYLDILQNIKIAHYLNNILLIWLHEQEMPSILEAMVDTFTLEGKGWTLWKSPHRITTSFTSSGVLGRGILAHDV